MSHRLACYSPSFRIPRKPQKPSQQLRKKNQLLQPTKAISNQFHRCYCCSIPHCRRLTPQKCPINHLVIHSYYASCCCCCKKGSQIGNLVSNQVITAGHNEWMASMFLKMNLRLRMFNLSTCGMFKQCWWIYDIYIYCIYDIKKKNYVIYIYILYSWMGFQQASWWFPIASADNMGQARAVKRKWPKWHTPMVASKPMGTINMRNWWNWWKN